jgi:hypothetical protein
MIPITAARRFRGEKFVIDCKPRAHGNITA